MDIREHRTGLVQLSTKAGFLKNNVIKNQIKKIFKKRRRSYSKGEDRKSLRLTSWLNNNSAYKT